MKKILVSVAAAGVLFGGLNAKEYVVDTVHSEVGFKVKHMQVSNARGGFSDFTGLLDIDPETKKLNSLSGVVKIASVDTKNESRDEHLKADDYFDAVKFPEMKFEMTEFIGKDGNEEGKVKGNLTIKDKTLPVEFDYEFGGFANVGDADKVGFSLEGKIDRTKFGVGEASVALGSEVSIEIEIEADAK